MEALTPFKVLTKFPEAERVTTLLFIPNASALPSFTPGQFVNVYLPEVSAEGKSYTIASTPDDPHLAISVKATGKFSRALSALNKWDSALLSEPHGFFYPTDETTPRIFIAGGIGIMPFMSILRSASRARPGRNPGFEHMGLRIMFLYSNRSEAEAPFLAELDQLAAAYNAFSVRYFFTRASKTARKAALRRITHTDLKETAADVPGCHWFVSGSIPFVRDMRIALRALDIGEDRIFTESFF